MKVVKTHERAEEILRDERKRVQEAINLFKNSRGWRSMSRAKTLTKDLRILDAIRNLNPHNPLSILVEMKIMIEKLDPSQGPMIAYEDFLTSEYRLIRTQLRVYEGLKRDCRLWRKLEGISPVRYGHYKEPQIEF